MTRESPKERNYFIQIGKKVSKYRLFDRFKSVVTLVLQSFVSFDEHLLWSTESQCWDHRHSHLPSINWDRDSFWIINRAIVADLLAHLKWKKKRNRSSSRSFRINSTSIEQSSLRWIVGRPYDRKENPRVWHPSISANPKSADRIADKRTAGADLKLKLISKVNATWNEWNGIL